MHNFFYRNKSIYDISFIYLKQEFYFSWTRYSKFCNDTFYANFCIQLFENIFASKSPTECKEETPQFLMTQTPEIKYPQKRLLILLLTALTLQIKEIMKLNISKIIAKYNNFKPLYAAKDAHSSKAPDPSSIF